jgi:hypothetical protein
MLGLFFVIYIKKKQRFLHVLIFFPYLCAFKEICTNYKNKP